MWNRHLAVRDHFVDFAGEITDVECSRNTLRGADLLYIDAKVGKDAVRNTARITEGGQTVVGEIFWNGKKGNEVAYRQSFPAGHHFDRRKPGEKHCQIDRATRSAIRVLKSNALFGQRAENSGLVGNAHSAASQD